VVAQNQKDRAEPKTVCKERSCPIFAVKEYLTQLRQALPYVPPIPVGALVSLHDAEDYHGMVVLIKKAMNIEGRLKVAWVKSGGPKEVAEAPAWIEMPADMPFYGTEAFREATITMSIRKSAFEQYTYDQVAVVVAHELSHIVLNSIRHPLRGCEKAVDLTAMLLGFRQLYASGSYKEWSTRNNTQSYSLGYLRPQEVRVANQILAQGERLPEIKVLPSLAHVFKLMRPAQLTASVILIAAALGTTWFILVGKDSPVMKTTTVRHPPTPPLSASPNSVVSAPPPSWPPSPEARRKQPSVTTWPAPYTFEAMRPLPKPRPKSAPQALPARR
jgi:hypothetical protein